MEHSVCLLDANIQSLLDVQLHPLLRTVSLHGNSIRRIQNLNILHNLRHLDLSSNRITVIEGLDGLVMLRTLNLSCNFIQTVEGLKNLRCLVSIDLSHNRIADITGFRDVSGPQYQLQQISLHGNCIQSSSHVVQALRNCTTLCELVLKHESSGNPVCDTPGYRQALLNAFPWLRVLDESDRSGRSVPLCEGMMQGRISDMEPYLDFLYPSSETKETANSENNNIPMLLPPKLEDEMESYSIRGTGNSSNSVPLEDDQEPAKDLINLEDEEEFRIPSLDCQPVANLKRNRHLSRSSPALETSHDGMPTSSARLTASTVIDYKGSRSELSHPRRFMLMSKTSESTQSTTSSSDEKNTQPTRRSTPNLRMKRRSNKRDVAYDSDSTTDFTECGESYRVHRGSMPRSMRHRRKHGSGSSKNSKRNLFSRSPSSGHPENDSSDNPGMDEEALVRSLASPHHMNRKEGEESAFLTLIKELDVEREMRWRAEQAAGKLSEQIQQLQNKAFVAAMGDHSLQEAAVAVTDRLKQALMREREARGRMQAEFELMKEKNKELSHRLQEAEAVEEDLRHTQRAMESSVNKLEAEKIKQQNHTHSLQRSFLQARLAQEAQLKASTLIQEVEHLKNSIRALKAQVHQLQNLLAAREQEHRREMETKLSGKKDIQLEVAKEVGKEKQRYEMELNSQQERLEQLQQKYLELEDEFRMALHLEATRFKELQEAYVSLSDELTKKKQTVAMAQDKERESASVMMELTSIVKEQKSRITELLKTKQEAQLTIKSLESQVHDVNRSNMLLEVVSKEKTKLEAQLIGQEAVIEGMKAEKKLWNQELAQKGASIAHDRSRLESRIEGLEVEVSMLKKQLEREVDVIRVKNKVIEDQTEAIRKLKEAVQNKDEDVKNVRDSLAEEQRTIEDQLAVQIAINHELQQGVESLSKRKDELRQQVTEQQLQIADYKKEQAAMNAKWKEKAEMISRLEVQVRQMKEAWEVKERKLLDERDRAIDAARKRYSRDDSYGNTVEIDEQRKKYEERIAVIIAEKQQQVEKAYQKVEEMEERMQQSLREATSVRKNLEDKVHKLTCALSEMHEMQQQGERKQRSRVSSAAP